jgi:hypothetical protein
MQEKLNHRLIVKLSEVELSLKRLVDNDLRHIRSDIKQVDNRIKMVERLTLVILAAIIAGSVGVILS